MSEHPADRSAADDQQAEWAARSRSFGAVAEDYDRYRPGYPAELFADVLALGPGPRVLEAGAGTGRATLGLLRAGATVHAVEPDPAMAAVARRRTAGLPVTLQEAAFERSEPSPGGFDLVTAAQSWHWVDQVAGPAVAARALTGGGVLAIWWNRPSVLEGPVWDAIHEAYARHGPTLEGRKRHTHIHNQPERSDHPPAPGFEPWTRADYEWTQTYTADDYVAMIVTHSDHIRLDATTRERLVDGVRAAIVEVGGGTLEYPYRTMLSWARPG